MEKNEPHLPPHHPHYIQCLRYSEGSSSRFEYGKWFLSRGRFFAQSVPYELKQVKYFKVNGLLMAGQSSAYIYTRIKRNFQQNLHNIFVNCSAKVFLINYKKFFAIQSSNS